MNTIKQQDIHDHSDHLDKLKMDHSMQNIEDHSAYACLLYTSDAADERSSVDLGGRRIIKTTNNKHVHRAVRINTKLPKSI